jgi:uncharacterized spore protein YtfJ
MRKEEIMTMDREVEALLEAVADVRDRANVNAVFGDPVTVEGHTVIPVARVAYTFSVGVSRRAATGEMDAEKRAGTKPPDQADSDSRGSVGGMVAHPIAVIEVTPEGTRVKPVVDEQKLALAGGLLGAWIVVWLARTLVRIFGKET